MLRYCLLAFCLATTAAVADEPAPRFSKLVWQDEFNGDTLDYSKWGVEVNAFGGGNGERQIYTGRPQNVRVEAGQIEWWIDGQRVQTQIKWHSTGGGFVGPPDDTTPFPRKMLIDYVRVYQQNLLDTQMIARTLHFLGHSRQLFGGGV